MTVTIRPAAPEDAEAISGVHIRARLKAYAEIMSPQALALMNAQVTPRHWAVRLRPSARRGWGLVAVEDGTVVGFVFVCPSGEGLPGVGDVEALHIDPAHQGKGVGRQLHDAALDLLAGEGLTSYALWVLEGNTRAIGFYLRHGWRPDGQRLRDVGGDFLRFVWRAPPER